MGTPLDLHSAWSDVLFHYKKKQNIVSHLNEFLGLEKRTTCKGLPLTCKGLPLTVTGVSMTKLGFHTLTQS